MGPSFKFVSAGYQEHFAQGAALRRRLYPVWIQLLCIPAVAVPMICGAVGGYYLGTLAGKTQDPTFFMLLGLVPGYFAGLRLMSLVNTFGFKRLGGIAASTEVPTSFLLDEEGVHYAISTLRCSIPWQGVEFVFVDRGTLHFASGLTSYYVPARCFATEADRQNAWDYAMARLSEDARRRSLV